MNKNKRFKTNGFSYSSYPYTPSHGINEEVKPLREDQMPGNIAIMRPGESLQILKVVQKENE
jgi:hypothetical protein